MKGQDWTLLTDHPNKARHNLSGSIGFSQQVTPPNPGGIADAL